MIHIAPPTVCEFFKSSYYLNTHLPPVDLSDKELSKQLLDKEDPVTAARAQQVISSPEVQKALSETFTYTPEGMAERNEVLQRHGFTLLSSKPNMQTGESLPFYSVVEHPNLPGWVIKSGATRIPKDQFILGPGNDRNEMAHFTENESLLRLEMAQRVLAIAQKVQIEVVVPKKKLVAYANTERGSEPSRKYCVLCQKVDILSTEITVQTIQNMPPEQQKETAKKISTIVQKAGLVDASFDNIRLTREGKLAFIDTEPGGLMAAKKPGCYHRLFPPKGSSVEKCARIGLYTLITHTSKAARSGIRGDLSCEPGLEAFRAEVEKNYKPIASPKFSKAKIALSIVSLALIPIVNLIIAVVKKIFTVCIVIKLHFANQAFQQEQWRANRLNPNLESEHQKKTASLANRFFAAVEGVPYRSPVPNLA
ncbi:MAG: hypothetical protein KGJ02_03405 [Verrucomicrobiota bacterium]|nr:hypothetical protein [Verrucomicrobiota bacterium]